MRHMLKRFVKAEIWGPVSLLKTPMAEKHKQEMTQSNPARIGFEGEACLITQSISGDKFSFNMQRDRVISFIDGFNLYHAILTLNDPQLKWLDLRNPLYDILNFQAENEFCPFLTSIFSGVRLGA